MTIPELLQSAKTIAVVGLSSNPARPSFGVSRHMQRAGYRIIPVNPNEAEVLGEKSYARVLDIPGPVDIVNIFRRPNRVGEHVEDAIAKGAKAIWMQLDIVNEEAARRAEEAGLLVVMDRCIAVEHSLIHSEAPLPDRSARRDT